VRKIEPTQELGNRGLVLNVLRNAVK